MWAARLRERERVCVCVCVREREREVEAMVMEVGSMSYQSLHTQALMEVRSQHEWLPQP